MNKLSALSLVVRAAALTMGLSAPRIISSMLFSRKRLGDFFSSSSLDTEVLMAKYWQHIHDLSGKPSIIFVPPPLMTKATTFGEMANYVMNKIG